MKLLNVVIGISGSRLSGKDTAALILQDLCGAKVTSLADPIKIQYADLMGISLDTLYTQGIEKEKHRMGLITLGAVRRSDNEDWWCEELHKTHQNLSLVIPDIRFRNEVDYFTKNSKLFVLLEINSSYSTKVRRGWIPSVADATTSETERQSFASSINFSIDNDETLELLQEKIRNVLYSLDLSYEKV